MARLVRKLTVFSVFAAFNPLTLAIIDAGGFIGSLLVEDLKGRDVIGLDPVLGRTELPVASPRALNAYLPGF